MKITHKPRSIWRLPDISARWWPVFLRNLLVWRKLAIPSLVGNIAEPLMWLVAFGYGMGALVGQVNVGGASGGRWGHGGCIASSAPGCIKVGRIPSYRPLPKAAPP